MFKKLKIRQKVKEFNNNLPSSFDDAVISWVTCEHHHHERGIAWKTIAITCTFLAAILSFFYISWTFSLVILVSAAVYALIAFEETKAVEVTISDVGIKIGTRKYPFSRIQAFWIIYEPPYFTNLNFRVTGQFPADIHVELAGHNPGPLREYLLTKIPEFEGKRQNLSHIFFRLFKI